MTEEVGLVVIGILKGLLAAVGAKAHCFTGDVFAGILKKYHTTMKHWFLNEYQKDLTSNQERKYRFPA